jgi:hypothetical protein
MTVRIQLIQSRKLSRGRVLCQCDCKASRPPRPAVYKSSNPMRMSSRLSSSVMPLELLSRCHSFRIPRPDRLYANIKEKGLKARTTYGREGPPANKKLSQGCVARRGPLWGPYACRVAAPWDAAGPSWERKPTSSGSPWRRPGRRTASSASASAAGPNGHAVHRGDCVPSQAPELV